MSDVRGAGRGLLFEEVVSVLGRAEPPPAEVVAAAAAAYEWRSVAAAIAGLEFDSVLDDDDDMVRVRDSGSEWRLRFRGPGRVVDVSVIDGGRRLVGRFDPPLIGSVLLRQAGGSTSTAKVDDQGRFFFDDLPRGAISLRPLPTYAATPDFDTEWVTM
jgi:hypothetical protein